MPFSALTTEYPRVVMNTLLVSIIQCYVQTFEAAVVIGAVPLKQDSIIDILTAFKSCTVATT